MKKRTKVQGQGLPQWLQRLMLQKAKPQLAATALLDKIKTCTTLEELKALLLSKEVVLDEQLMAAFDKRIAELGEQTGQTFLY
jgi:hypothetical protein